ncbi:MAG: toxin-activating lysine-acyltransferase, partial [Pontibacterium sp.]
MTDEDKSLYQVIGEVVKLMACTDTYRHYTIEQIERLVLPALLTGNARLYYDEEEDLAGYISFTFLRPDSEINFIDRKGLINDEDWMTTERDGNLWIMDFIAPFGGASEMCKHTYDYLAKQYQGRRLFFRRVAQSDRINSVVLKHGAPKCAT